MITVTLEKLKSKSTKKKGMKYARFYIKSSNWTKPKRPSYKDITFYNRADTDNKKKHNKHNEALAEAKRRELAEHYAGAQFQNETSDNITLLAQLEEIIELKRDKARATIGGYNNLLTAMKRFCGEKGFNIRMDINRCNIEFVDQWRLWLTTDNTYAQSTAFKYFTLLGTVFKTAKRYGKMFSNPYDGDIDYPKNEKIEKVFLTPEEVLKLKKTYTKHDVMKNAFLFMCYTGLRQGDCTNLTWADLPMANGEMKLNVRTQKAKTNIFFKIREAAEQFLPKRMGDTDIIFPIKFSNPVNKNLRNWALRAGVDKHITAHSARHTFAYFMLSEKNTPLYTVSKLLGHTNARTTEDEYGHLSNENIEEAMSKAFGK